MTSAHEPAGDVAGRLAVEERPREIDVLEPPGRNGLDHGCQNGAPALACLRDRFAIGEDHYDGPSADRTHRRRKVLKKGDLDLERGGGGGELTVSDQPVPREIPAMDPEPQVCEQPHGRRVVV